MSVLSLQSPSSGDESGKTRKDVKIDEGQVIQGQARHQG